MSILRISNPNATFKKLDRYTLAYPELRKQQPHLLMQANFCWRYQFIFPYSNLHVFHQECKLLVGFHAKDGTMLCAATCKPAKVWTAGDKQANSNPETTNSIKFSNPPLCVFKSTNFSGKQSEKELLNFFRRNRIEVQRGRRKKEMELAFAQRQSVSVNRYFNQKRCKCKEVRNFSQAIYDMYCKQQQYSNSKVSASESTSFCDERI